jgi:uncharacterized protein (TIGR03437 family)
MVALFVGTAGAQNTPFTITAFSAAVGSANNTYTTTISGTGTATVSGFGNATVQLSGTSTRDCGLNCGNYVQLSIVLTFNPADSFSIGLTWPSATAGSGVPLPISVTGGTGTFKGRGGSGSMTVTLNGSALTGLSLTGTGSGTLTSTATPTPAILPGGVVPVFSSVPIIQPGSWVSIYGTNLANTTAIWNGDFPTTLGGVSVTIDNHPAFLSVVTPNQINVQAPDDNIQGCVNVVVSTPNGQVSSQVTLQPQQPSFSLLGDGAHAAAVIPTPDHSGAYAGGAYDLNGPVGAFPYRTRPVKVGETIVLYGVGFGATTTAVPAGKNPAVPYQTLLTPAVSIGGVPAAVTYSGLISAGLYQLNVVVPQVPGGDQLVTATLFAPNPILFSADITQNCKDDDPQGAKPTGCAIYVTVK